MDSNLTVVIAAKDEAPTIGDVVAHARRLAQQVIVVDGHSIDETHAIACRGGADVLSDGGRGKGDAIRTAIPHIRGDVTVFLDADGSHLVCDIPRLVEPILRGEADHVTASRLLGGSSELHGGFDEFLRLAGSSFITACINWRFGVRLSDSQNGFRAIRTCVLRELALRENHTTIEQEMVMRTLRLGYRVAECPSHELARQYGSSHVNIWRSAPRYGWSLLRNLIA
jgi:glycosyltransferase involved in cell wall biosynthesis